MNCPYKKEFTTTQHVVDDKQSYRQQDLSGFGLEVLQKFQLFHRKLIESDEIMKMTERAA